MDLTFGLKIGPKLEDWFLKLGEVLSWVGTSKILQESDATLMPLHFFISRTKTLVSTQVQNSALDQEDHVILELL